MLIECIRIDVQQLCQPVLHCDRVVAFWLVLFFIRFCSHKPGLAYLFSYTQLKQHGLIRRGNYISISVGIVNELKIRKIYILAKFYKYTLTHTTHTHTRCSRLLSLQNRFLLEFALTSQRHM